MDLTSNLPDELLLEILAESAPYFSLFNHDRLRGSNYVWAQILGHRICLTMVCKRWNNLALPLMYGHVVLRRPSQLEPFTQSVSNPELGSLVQELTLTDQCSIDPHFDPIYLCLEEERVQRALIDHHELQKSLIQALPHLCQKLSRLCIRAEITEKVLLDIISHPNLFHITDFHLQLNDLGSYLSFDKLKAWFPNAAGRIRQLSFDGEDASAFSYWRDADRLTWVEFPVLEELRLGKKINCFPHTWSLPALTRLTIDCEEQLSVWWTRAFDQERAFESLCLFLRKCGSQIEQLALLGQVRVIPEGFPIDPILSLCPKVAYIALDLLPSVRESHSSFRNVKRIDVYPQDHKWNWEHERESFIDIVSCFPSLESIRILCGKVDFERLFFLLPLPFDVDPIQVFREACVWLGDPKVEISDLSMPLGLDTRVISVQCASFRPNEEGLSDPEDSTYYPSDSDSEDTTSSEEMDSDGSDL